MKHIYIILLLLLLIILVLPYLNTTTSFSERFQNVALSPRLTTNQIVNLKKGQTKMTNMLREFDRICLKYNLKYWCSGGTLIGILHSSRWLPWDGDIDVCMLDTDYKILEVVIQKELPHTMWFQTSKTDKYFKRPLGITSHLPSKIRDLNSCYLNCQDGVRWHNGLQIDISTYQKEGNRLISNATLNDYIDYDYNFIFPVKRARFDGIDVYIPNKYKEYSIKNWGCYPPKYSPVHQRYPHEGLVDSNNTCSFHMNQYKNIYNLM